MMTCKDCRDALSPFIDGELSREESEELNAHLATCGECASRGRAMAKVKEQGRTLPRFAAPDVLKARVRASVDAASGDSAMRLPAPRRRRVYGTLVAVGSAVILVLGYVRYERYGRAERAAVEASAQSEQSEVLARHLRSLAPGNLTQVISTDQHNVKPWFNGRVDVSPPVVSLDSLGFRLVGGRVDTVQGRATAVVVYGRRLHTINVFAWPASGPNLDLTTSDQNGFHLIRGRRQGVELWIVSDLNRAELLDFANHVLRDY